MGFCDVIVVGGGIIGTASAHFLSKRGHKVQILEQAAIPNPLGSSGDHASAFPLTHGKDSFYTDLAVKAQALWRELQHDTHQELLLQNGVLELAAGDGAYEESCFKALSDLKLPVQKLNQAQLRERYRMLRVRGFKFGVFHQGGGMVWVKKAAELFAKATEKSGGRADGGVRVVKVLKDKAGIQGLQDSKGKVWRSQNYVFAPGAWTRELLADVGLPLTVTKQECLYLRPPCNQGRYRPAHFPIISIRSKGIQCFPVHIHGFMKVSHLRKGVLSRSPGIEAEPDKDFEKKCRGFLKDLFQDLSNFADLEGRVAHFTRTPDGDFILDRLPGLANGWLATGFAGAACTFAPLVGQLLSQLVSGEKPALNLHRFRIGRLRLRPKR